jgi:hypothetical protein
MTITRVLVQGHALSSSPTRDGTTSLGTIAPGIFPFLLTVQRCATRAFIVKKVGNPGDFKPSRRRDIVQRLLGMAQMLMEFPEIELEYSPMEEETAVMNRSGARINPDVVEKGSLNPVFPRADSSGHSS